MKICFLVSIQYTNETDGQRDRQRVNDISCPMHSVARQKPLSKLTCFAVKSLLVARGQHKSSIRFARPHLSFVVVIVLHREFGY